ncbi:hypothetical protein [Streptomyces sp. NBC_01506]|uniref:hypothetical protein n=1 Tax=Streptomyces sp. NBC_01506 TaxID=2903887 RepID=UPI00386F9B7D
MSEAVYGLLGALGGALVTGGATFWGPLQAQRSALRAQRRQAEATMRETEAANAEVQGRANREAETTRVILMRTTTRTWHDLLARTIQDLKLGRLVDIESFDEAVAIARNSAQSALDHALHDGIWIHQSGYGYPYPSESGSPEQSRVLHALRRVTELTRVAVIKQEPLDTVRTEELERALVKADEARGALSAALLNRLEQLMGVTVIGGRASTPTLPGAFGPVTPEGSPEPAGGAGG